MKKEKIIYTDLMILGKLAHRAATDMATEKNGVSNENDRLSMMTMATMEFISAYLLHRHLVLLNELEPVPQESTEFLKEQVNDGPPGLKEYLDGNLPNIEDLLKEKN